VIRDRLATLRRYALAEGGLPLVFILLTVLALVPVWHQRLLPMLDTPNHLALARMWHSYNDPQYRIAEFYTLRIRLVPYIFSYWFLHMLMYVVSIETANKLFLSLYLILFPLSILQLARAFKRSPWLAVGAFPLAFNQNWIYGFSSYLMGTAFMFFSFASLVRYYQNGRTRHLIVILVGTVLAYLCHIMPWFIFGCGAIGILVLRWRDWRRGVRAAAVMFPSLALALAAVVQEQSEHAYMNKGGKFAAAWRDFPTSVMEFPRRVMEIIPGNLDYAILTVLALTVLALLIWKGRRVEGETDEERKTLPLVLIIMGLAYITIPFQIHRPFAWWYVAPRVPSMMAPFLLLLPSARLKGWHRFVMLPVIVCAIVLPLKLARLYRDFSVRNAPFMRLVAQIPNGVSTLVVARGMMRGPHSEEESGDPATAGPVYWHFSSWPAAFHGGFDPYMFDQGVPVRPRVLLRAPDWTKPDTFDIRQAPEFEYYLVRFAPPPMESEPSIKLVDQVGDWSLFRRVYKMTDEP
jgi:hypothetical protein